jgi:hypothetical protein
LKELQGLKEQQQQQQQQQNEQRQQQQQQACILVKPRVRNAAACILKLAVGVEAFQTPSTSSHVTTSRVGEQLHQLTGLEKRALDSIITRRNMDAHPSTLAKLDEEVHELSTFLPGLEKACRHECAVLRAYDAIKASFPSAFK